MPFPIDKLPHAPIVIIDSRNQVDFVAALSESLVHIRAMYDSLAEPCFVIVDLSGMLLNLSEHMDAASLTSAGPGTISHHPMVREMVFVTSDASARSALRSMNSAPFGFTRVSVHDTRDMALTYCYRQIGK